MSDKIDISVVMSVYNNVYDVELAVKSILEQTFERFELIVVDDFSDDGSSLILERLRGRDSRIRVLKNSCNMGLAYSLNLAIANAKGRYIARMDADDFSYPDRFETQFKFLEENSAISVVGTNAELICDSGKLLRVTSLPESPAVIKDSISKLCPLVHPSVMFRKKFIDFLGGYDDRLRKKQDYDLWLRGVDRFNYANLTTPYLKYKVAGSKSIQTDLYGFYVRVLNGYRRKKLLKSLGWAINVLVINILRKFGYKQRMHKELK